MKNLQYLNKDIIHSKFGFCNICGKITLFICTNQITSRNNMFCIYCKSSSRNRLVSKAILAALYQSKLKSIKKIRKYDNQRIILNTGVNDVFYRVLYGHQNFLCSELIPDVENGLEIKKNVFCQNLENLKFSDETFDLVISQDVLEHVRDFKKALHEIWRILKPYGYHIFTVPFFFDKKTITRIQIDGDKDIQLLPPEYHGDSVRGKIIAYRTFGIDLIEILEGIGFKTNMDFSRFIDEKNGIFDSMCFISLKPKN